MSGWKLCRKRLNKPFAPVSEKRAPMLIRIILLASTALATSCIDGREEYWIDTHGAGRAEITYSLPSALARMHGSDADIQRLMEDFLKTTPAITTRSCQITTSDKTTTAHIHVTFDSAMDLMKISKGTAIRRLPSAMGHLMGEIQAKIHGRTLDLKRTVRSDKAVPGSFFMPRSTFEGHHLTYTVHLPASARQSNATREEDDGRTLIWEIPLVDALESPLVTHFTMDVPIPWIRILAIAVPSILVCGFALLQIRKTFIRRKALPSTSSRTHLA